TAEQTEALATARQVLAAHPSLKCIDIAAGGLAAGIDWDNFNPCYEHLTVHRTGAMYRAIDKHNPQAEVAFEVDDSPDTAAEAKA
ncbi:MAG: hypothetical protein KDJ36_05755, partial [Hyphomicrobiaceae bacterium]|nr:hypothetical protein [Hyphomicrobiaceae bacterium]